MCKLAAVVLCAGVLASRASASLITFTDTMLGSNETPPNASTATGHATVILDTVAQTLNVMITFTGLTGGPASAAHIHCCAGPGVAAAVAVPFTGFPNTTSGTYNNTFDLTLAGTYTSGFLATGGGTAAGAESLLISSMNAGLTYTNIHNTTFPGGEIRGQLAPAAVPEPTTLALGASSLLLLGLLRKRRA